MQMVLTNKNKITDLGVLNDGTDKQRIGNDFANAIGGPANQYFVVYKGVNPNGNLLFTDINGADTESPTDADRRQPKIPPVSRWIL
jgi:hypothetical protein